MTELEIRKNGLLMRTLVTVNDPNYWPLKNKKGYGYNFGNGMRHHGFESSEYFMTENVEKYLIENGHDINEVKPASYYDKIKGIDGSPMFTPEHVIPVNVIKGLIKASVFKNGNFEPMRKSELKELLDLGSIVCLVIKKTEDKLLECDLKSNMPEGCNPRETPFGRYDLCNIKVSDRKLKLKV